jgi:hypothetical protein
MKNASDLGREAVGWNGLLGGSVGDPFILHGMVQLPIWSLLLIGK